MTAGSADSPPGVIRSDARNPSDVRLRVVSTQSLRTFVRSLSRGRGIGMTAVFGKIRLAMRRKRPKLTARLVTESHGSDCAGYSSAQWNWGSQTEHPGGARLGAAGRAADAAGKH